MRDNDRRGGEEGEREGEGGEREDDGRRREGESGGSGDNVENS